MSEIKYDFDKYKNALRDYLTQKGIDFFRKNIRCINPAHKDAGPSMAVYEDNCYCFGCNKRFDIYDAVGFLEGISDRGEQFRWVDSHFGTGEGSISKYVPKEPVPAKEKKEPDKKALETLENYFKKISILPAAQKAIKNFLDCRARYTTQGQIKSYPSFVEQNLLKTLYYWPGFDAAEAELGWQTLVAAGIGGRNPEKNNKSSWDHSGVALKESNGFKLHYYIDDKTKCVKWNGSGVTTFPQPYCLPFPSSIILVEGEMDALACNAAGFNNVFSAGGTGGISKEKVQKYLLDVPEVIFLFDKDTAGKENSGIIPFTDGKGTSSRPEIFRQAGYKGIIKVAQLPEDCDYKDCDECIINNRIDLIETAVKNAQEWKSLPKPGKPKPADRFNEKGEEEFDTIGIKRLKALLKKIEYSAIDESDVYLFVNACMKACKSTETRTELTKWAAASNAVLDEKTIKENSGISPYFLLEACDKYGVSKYLRNELEAALIPASRIVKSIKDRKTIVKLDYDKILKSESFNQFFEFKDAASAAQLIVEIFNGRLRYTENDKKNWFFNGFVWVREPDVAGIAYTILCSLIKKYLEKNPKEKKAAKELLVKIGGRPFRQGITQDINGTKPDVWCESLPFDGPQIRETLTLLDGVMDFSGNKIEFRQSQAEDYRREMLPYTVDEVRNAKTPENFLKFMRGNFANEETLNSLFYYLSLIPSRNTGYKYGGVFLGEHDTGKSTTLNVIEAVFSGCCVRLKTEVLVSAGGRNVSGNEATPEIAKLEGRCAAFVQETARNAALNTNFWKELTGGDTLTARMLRENPHDFLPTAQIIIASNYAPSFDAHDDAAFTRMAVYHFKIQHAKGSKDTKTSNDFVSDLRPEFPAIIKFLCEKYVDLHINLKGNIPFSQECIAYKDLYREEQKTDLDRFFEANIKVDLEFDPATGEPYYEKTADVYQRYLDFYQLTEDSKEAMSRAKVIKYLRRDHRELILKQKRFGGNPEQIFQNIKLVKWENAAQKQQPKETKQPAPPPRQQPQYLDLEPPEDNPFDDDQPDIF